MAETRISWAHYTFNPWEGCERIAPACAHCYAAERSNRFHKLLGLWSGNRRSTSDAYWNQLPMWNAKARAAGERRRVFVMSLGDIFDGHPDTTVPRQMLFGVLEECRALDFLLLTKRPQNIAAMAPPWWMARRWPDHVWLGVTTENQKQLGMAMEYLPGIPAPVRFLSCEPLLEDLDLRRAGGVDPLGDGIVRWVIGGGEAGLARTVRPTHVNWARRLRDQCVATGAAFHWKQWGAWLPGCQEQGEYTGLGQAARPGNLHRWADGSTSYRVKDWRLNLLDGRQWLEFPADGNNSEDRCASQLPRPEGRSLKELG